MTDATIQVTIPSKLQTRRAFIQAMLGLIAAGWAGWVTQGVLFPAPSTQAEQIRLALTDLPVGAVKAITYAGKPAIVMRSSEGATAFSLICTHLGCTVQWQEGKQQFFCPCHDGYYDRNGDVVSGPPPMPLEQLQAKIVGSEVVVGEG